MDIQGPYSLTVPEYPATSVELTINANGLIVGVGIALELGAYSTSLDVAITEENDNCPVEDILGVSGLTTDAWYYPDRQACDTQGADIAGYYAGGIPVHGQVVLSVTNAVPGDVVHIVFKLYR